MDPAAAETLPSAPRDTELTGLPLPILPIHPNEKTTQRWDRHHGFYYSADYENGTIGMRATRFSRLQYTPRWLHERFHRFYRGTKPPESELQQFGLTILGFAGYVPELAIDVSGSEPRTVELSSDQRDELQAPGIFRIERSSNRRAEIGQFLMGYVIGRGSDELNNGLKDEFLHTTDTERRTYLGFKLIAKSIEYAVEPVNPLYELAVAQRALRVGAAPCAELLVKRYVINYAPDYFVPLANQLIAA